MTLPAMHVSVRDLVLTVVLLVVTILGCSLGGSEPAPVPADGEVAAINALLDEFQSAYSAKDMTRLRATFHAKANVAIDFSNTSVPPSYRIDEWIPVTQELLKNKRSVSVSLSNRDIMVYRNIATVVADYNHRVDGALQAGQDIMIVTKLGGAWKIFSGSAATPLPVTNEVAAINALIDEFQSSYSAKDMLRLRATFHTKANVAIDFNNSSVQSSQRIDEWIPATQALLRDKRSVSDILSNREITVYSNIATVVADYNYRADGEHQAGQDIMIVTKVGGSWKILSLTFYGDVVS